MKTLRTNPVPRSVSVSFLFGSLVLASSSLVAQTFTGRDYLNESPVSIRAFVYSDTRNGAIIIRLESRGAKAVRVQILDENRRSVYDDYVMKPAYYGRFDVSALSYGAYTVELSTPTARHIQGFRLERPLAGQVVDGYLVMAIFSTKPDSIITKN